MKLKSINEMNIKEGLLNGSIIPDDAIDVVVWKNSDCLEIQIDSSDDLFSKLDQFTIFLWDYYKRKAIFIRDYKIENNSVVWKYEKSIKQQMVVLQSDSLRIAYALKTGNEYNCGFFRNKAIKNGHISQRERIIGALGSDFDEIIVANWAENGALVVNNRNKKNFVKEYSCLEVDNIIYEDKKFICITHLPLIKGTTVAKMISLATGDIVENIEVKYYEEKSDSVYRYLKLEIDLLNHEQDFCETSKIVVICEDIQFEIYAKDDTEFFKKGNIQRISESSVVVCEYDKLVSFQKAVDLYNNMISIISYVKDICDINNKVVSLLRLNLNTDTIQKHIIGNETNDYSQHLYFAEYEVVLVCVDSNENRISIEEFRSISNKLSVVYVPEEKIMDWKKLGLEVATGRYCTFIDDGKKITEDFIKTNYSLLSEKNEIKEYKFSIVMAAYNEEKYISEAIESIVYQTIGFTNNVQLIICDDGSTDKTKDIITHYVNLYPYNITLVSLCHNGASAARNAGLKLVKGKYVNFCDADDYLSANACELVWNFFEKYQNKIDVVTIPIMLFGKQNEKYWQNYKFKGKNRIVDLWTEHDVSVMNAAASFVKYDAIEEYFDPGLIIAEDTLFLAKLLMKKMAVGLVEGCTYYYRKHWIDSESLVAQAKYNEKYYSDYFTNYVFVIFEYAKKMFGFVPMWLQSTVMMDLQWHILLEDIPEDLSERVDKERYKGCIVDILKEIDDTIIMQQKKIYREHKLQCLKAKYGADSFRRIKGNDAICQVGNTVIYKLSTLITKIDLLEIRDNKLFISGFSIVDNKMDNYENAFEIDGKIYPLKRLDRETDTYNTMGLSRNTIPFEDELEIKDSIIGKKINLVLLVDGNIIYRNNFNLTKFCALSGKFRNQYYYKNGYILRFFDNAFHINICSSLDELNKYEKAYIDELRALKVAKVNEIAEYRRYAIDYRSRSHKKIWLISDKANRGDDNGEALFKYVIENANKSIEPYFVISGSCEDGKRLAITNRTVEHMSKQLKRLYLCAECVISAYPHKETENPFLTDEIYYRDFANDKHFVFLQHGIIMNDNSGLNRFAKRYSIFVTSTKDERKSIVGGKYYYDEKTVILSGLPRHDLLYSKPQKIITFMPTWRRNLCGEFNPANDQWELLPGFENSEYYLFYSQVLSNQKLRDALYEYGYTMQFMPHPVFFPHADEFKKINSEVKVLDGNARYRDLFATSDLVITDYSSAVMDFAILRKPVIYAQFDKKEFFTKQYKPGYFDYERDGFGEVIFDVQTLVDTIIEYMKNGCKMKKEYLDRCDNFFEFNDCNNCHRVYESIVELPEKVKQYIIN